MDQNRCLPKTFDKDKSRIFELFLLQEHFALEDLQKYLRYV